MDEGNECPAHINTPNSTSITVGRIRAMSVSTSRYLLVSNAGLFAGHHTADAETDE